MAIMTANEPSGKRHGRAQFRSAQASAALKKGPAPDHDPIRLNRIMISSLCLSMIFSENRFPLFRIMLQARSRFKCLTGSGRMRVRRRHVLGTPGGARAAHIMQFRPVRIECPGEELAPEGADSSERPGLPVAAVRLGGKGF
jgi:hypothetical protein